MDDIDVAYAKFETEQIAAGKVCGACELFADEDMSGNGWCHFSDGQTHCGGTCRHWTEREK